MMTNNLDYDDEGYAILKVKLSRPWKCLDGAELSELHIREPSVGDNESIEKKFTEPTEQVIHLVARLARPGLSPDEVRRLPSREFVRLRTTLENFMNAEDQTTMN